MADNIHIIGNPNHNDTRAVRNALDRNGVPYQHSEVADQGRTYTMARVDGVNIDFFGFNEPIIAHIVTQFEPRTIINN